MWKNSGLTGEYEAWAFGEAPDALAELVRQGVKTATCSAFAPYRIRGEKLPRVGGYSVILDSAGDAVCIVRTTRVSVIPFDRVPEVHARKEGEGDRSLEYWRRVHRDFLTRELGACRLEFDEQTPVVCEEFERV